MDSHLPADDGIRPFNKVICVVSSLPAIGLTDRRKTRTGFAAAVLLSFGFSYVATSPIWILSVAVTHWESVPCWDSSSRIAVLL